MHNTSNKKRHTAALSKYMQLGLHTMTPAIIAHYLVAIAVIAVFLTIALIREALLREAADRRSDEEFERMRAAARAAARRRTDALYLDFARRAGAPVELPADWDRLADCQKASRIGDLEEVAKRIERRAAFAARYGCEVKA